MDLEMLDGYLCAIVSGPAVDPAVRVAARRLERGRPRGDARVRSTEQAQRVMALMLRHIVGPPAHARRVADALQAAALPRRRESARQGRQGRPARRPRGARATWPASSCATTSGSRCTTREDARDWIFPLEALAFGDQDPEFSEWIDDKEKRASLVDELALAAVLIYRFWHERKRDDRRRASAARAAARRTAGARRGSGCTRRCARRGDWRLAMRVDRRAEWTVVAAIEREFLSPIARSRSAFRRQPTSLAISTRFPSGSRTYTDRSGRTAPVFATGPSTIGTPSAFRCAITSSSGTRRQQAEVARAARGIRRVRHELAGPTGAG